MSEKPIIMTGESVQAILENRKSQSRRVINPGKYLQCFDPEEDREQLLRVSPWQPGMKLWIRETWNVLVKGAYWWQYLDEASEDGGCIIWSQDRDGKFFYRADDVAIPVGWVSPMFMPRWASRIVLEITSVRVERVQDINEQDVIAEGIGFDIWDQALVARKYGTANEWFQTWTDESPNYVDESGLAVASYRSLWDSINAKRGYSWESNPYVWCIEFARIKP